MPFRLIDDCEKKDFDAAICDAGQLPEDFELEERVTALFVVEEGIAIVRAKKSGVERFYPIGHQTIFPADFIQELEEGVFR